AAATPGPPPAAGPRARLGADLPGRFGGPTEPAAGRPGDLGPSVRAPLGTPAGPAPGTTLGAPPGLGAPPPATPTGAEPGPTLGRGSAAMPGILPPAALARVAPQPPPARSDAVAATRTPTPERGGDAVARPAAAGEPKLVHADLSKERRRPARSTTDGRPSLVERLAAG
ncbi:hypothetical protein ACWENR_29350, partial [Micromonospora sp. NPDC004336]